MQTLEVFNEKTKISFYLSKNYFTAFELITDIYIYLLARH